MQASLTGCLSTGEGVVEEAIVRRKRRAVEGGRRWRERWWRLDARMAECERMRNVLQAVVATFVVVVVGRMVGSVEGPEAPPMHLQLWVAAALEVGAGRA